MSSISACIYYIRVTFSRNPNNDTNLGCTFISCVTLELLGSFLQTVISY